MTSETWAPLHGFENKYEISDMGNVRHVVWRRDGLQRNLKPFFNKGYPFIKIRGCATAKNIPIHRYVLMSFERLPKPGEEACHRDGDRSNVRFSNLLWGTHRVNESHKVAHNTLGIGSKNANSKLSEADVMAILERISRGGKLAGIASAYGISRSNVSMIKTGRNWPHVARMTQSIRLAIK